MTHSIRLGLTRLNDFQFVMSLYRGHPLFLFECVYLSLLYPTLIFGMFLPLCVCVCWSDFGFLVCACVVVWFEI